MGRYLELVTPGEIFKGADFVDTERDDFEVGHPLDELQVLQLVAPEVEILDAVQAVGFGLVEDQLLCQNFALPTHIITFKSCHN